jgi:hypothetical protein
MGMAFTKVFTFLGRLGLLIRHELISASDVKNLFGEEVKLWTRFLPVLDFSVPMAPQISSQE